MQTDQLTKVKLQKCKDCRWFNLIGGEGGVGYCMFNPPTLSCSKSNINPSRPKTKEEWVCYYWEASEIRVDDGKLPPPNNFKKIC